MESDIVANQLTSRYKGEFSNKKKTAGGERSFSFDTILFRIPDLKSNQIHHKLLCLVSRQKSLLSHI